VYTESPQSSSNSNSPITTTYCIGELVWGAVRGHPAWPGKVINPPEGFNTPSDCAWVRWFGGRPNAEMVSTQTLKSLSDGLEAHHKAQKDTRK
jgi:methyl-CpG-binding domain protein 5